MKAAIVKEAGGAENLIYSEVEKPGIKAGEILIRVHAAGVNGADLLQRAGLYAPPEGMTSLPQPNSESAWQVVPFSLL